MKPSYPGHTAVYLLLLGLVFFRCSFCTLPASAPPGGKQPRPESIFFDERGPDSIRIESGLQLSRQYIRSNPDSFLLIQSLMQRYGRERNSPSWEGNRLIARGNYYFLNGQGDSALICFKGAYGLVSDTNTLLYPRALSGIGLYHYQYGQLDSAIYYHLYALKHAQRHKDSILLNKLLTNLGVIHMDQRKTLEAIQFFEQAKPFANEKGKIAISSNLATMFVNFDMLEEARQEAGIIFPIAKKIKDTTSLIVAYRLMIASEVSDLNKITNWVDSAQTLLTRAVYRREFCHLLRIAGFRAHYVFNQPQQAKDYQQRAMSMGIEVCTPNVYCQVLSDLANLHLCDSQPAEALALSRKAQAIFGKKLDSYPVGRFDLFYTISKAFDALGQIDSAYHYTKLMDAKNLRKMDHENFNGTIKRYLSNKYAAENQVIKREKAAAEAITNAMRQRQTATYWLFTLASIFLLTLTLGVYQRYRANKRHALELAFKNEALAKTNAQLNRFSNIVSHDILSNLDLVLSTGNVLVGAAPKREMLLHYYETSQRTNQQLKQYCLNLLEAARREHQAAITDPMAIVRRILAQFEPGLQAANFQVSLGQLSSVPLPAAHTEQLFQNLIANALLYAATDPAPLLRIAEEITPSGRQIWVIEDNGPGVPETEREAIFNIREKGEGPGQQLGLSLLRASLREQGADITVEERSGGGARFVVSFLTKI